MNWDTNFQTDIKIYRFIDYKKKLDNKTIQNFSINTHMYYYFEYIAVYLY